MKHTNTLRLVLVAVIMVGVWAIWSQKYPSQKAATVMPQKIGKEVQVASAPEQGPTQISEVESGVIHDKGASFNHVAITSNKQPAVFLTEKKLLQTLQQQQRQSKTK